MGKTHEKVLDKYPPFRPILLVIKTLSYNLGKFLVPLTIEILGNSCRPFFFHPLLNILQHKF